MIMITPKMQELKSTSEPHDVGSPVSPGLRKPNENRCIPLSPESLTALFIGVLYPRTHIGVHTLGDRAVANIHGFGHKSHHMCRASSSRIVFWIEVAVRDRCRHVYWKRSGGRKEKLAAAQRGFFLGAITMVMHITSHIQ
jgi:hypothetical protein